LPFTAINGGPCCSGATVGNTNQSGNTDDACGINANRPLVRVSDFLPKFSWQQGWFAEMRAVDGARANR